MSIFDQVLRRKGNPFNAELLSRVNKGIDDIPRQVGTYIKENPGRSAAIGAAGLAGTGAAGALAGQIAKTSPDQYEGAARRENGAVGRSTGRSVDRLTNLNEGLGGVVTYKAMQQLKDNNKLGVRDEDTHAQANTKLGLIGGAAMGLGGALALPFALRKGRAGLKRYVDATYDEGSELRRLLNDVTPNEEVAKDATGLARKVKAGRIAAGTAGGAAVGAIGGYKSGIYEDEMDKREFNQERQGLSGALIQPSRR